MFWPNYRNLFFFFAGNCSHLIQKRKCEKPLDCLTTFHCTASQVCDSSMGERNGRTNTGLLLFLDGWRNIESRGDTVRTEFRCCLPCGPNSVFLSLHFLIFKLPLIVSVSQGRVRIKRDANKKYLVCSRFLISLHSLPPFLCLESVLFVSFPWLSSR